MHVAYNENPWHEEPGNLLVSRILEFVRFVRHNEFRIGVQEAVDAMAVARHCNVTDLKRLHWGLRSLLCTNPDEWKRCDELFHDFLICLGLVSIHEDDGTQNLSVCDAFQFTDALLNESSFSQQISEIPADGFSKIDDDGASSMLVVEHLEH